MTRSGLRDLYGIIVMKPERDCCGLGKIKPDSGEREATQQASRMTKYTVTEVGDKRNLDKSPKMSDSEKFLP